MYDDSFLGLMAFGFIALAIVISMAFDGDL